MKTNNVIIKNNNNNNVLIKKSSTFTKNNFSVKTNIKNKNKPLSLFYDNNSKNNSNNNIHFNNTQTLDPKYNLIPQFQKSLDRTEKLDDDIHYLAYKNKNKKGNIAHFKTIDYDRIIKRLSLKIEHKNNQLEKVEECNKKNEDEFNLLKNKIEKSINQNKFFGDLETSLKNQISEIRKQIQELLNQKRDYEFKTLQISEEVKYLKLDVEKWNKKVDKEKKEVEKGKKALTNYKEALYELTKGSKLSNDFVKKVAELIEKKEKK
jgi:hypothetical protein